MLSPGKNQTRLEGACEVTQANGIVRSLGAPVENAPEMLVTLELSVEGGREVNMGKEMERCPTRMRASEQVCVAGA